MYVSLTVLPGQHWGIFQVLSLPPAHARKKKASFPFCFAWPCCVCQPVQAITSYSSNSHSHLSAPLPRSAHVELLAEQWKQRAETTQICIRPDAEVREQSHCWNLTARNALSIGNHFPFYSFILLVAILLHSLIFYHHDT